MHLDFDDTVALTGLTAAALYIKGESAGIEPAQLGILRGGIQLADIRENAGISSGVGTGRPADGRLVDFDHLVQLREPLDFFKSAGTGFRPVQFRRQVFI